MKESVFRDLLKNGLVARVLVQEILPSKGKPAKKEIGSTTVWLIKFSYGKNKIDTLEAARGGPREWASLDNLSNWLKTCGVDKFEVQYLSEHDRLPQETFAFVNAS